jgi:hypothetical protein
MVVEVHVVVFELHVVLLGMQYAIVDGCVQREDGVVTVGDGVVGAVGAVGGAGGRVVATPPFPPPPPPFPPPPPSSANNGETTRGFLSFAASLTSSKAFALRSRRMPSASARPTVVSGARSASEGDHRVCAVFPRQPPRAHSSHWHVSMRGVRACRRRWSLSFR